MIRIVQGEIDRATDVPVSVILPVHNGALHLGRAISSVLGQTHRALELLVVDDGSTDDGAAVARSVADARVRVLSQPHAGAAAARNRGVALARGEFFSFIDADDTWEPEKTERQLAVLAARPDLDMVFGHAVNFRETADRWGKTEEHRHAPIAGHCVGTLLVRASAFHRVGPFSGQWRLGEFLDWYARAIDVGLTQLTLPDVVLNRRLHTDNLGVRERSARQDYARVVAGVLARRRRARRLGEERRRALG
jgi:glycosyltransferase involved in cell wall biosynthesis